MPDMDLQHWVFALLDFGLSLVQYFLTMSPFFPFGAGMFCAIILWKYVSCLLILQVLTVTRLPWESGMVAYYLIEDYVWRAYTFNHSNILGIYCIFGTWNTSESCLVLWCFSTLRSLILHSIWDITGIIWYSQIVLRVIKQTRCDGI